MEQEYSPQEMEYLKKLQGQKAVSGGTYGRERQYTTDEAAAYKNFSPTATRDYINPQQYKQMQSSEFGDNDYGDSYIDDYLGIAAPANEDGYYKDDFAGGQEGESDGGSMGDIAPGGDPYGLGPDIGDFSPDFSLQDTMNNLNLGTTAYNASKMGYSVADIARGLAPGALMQYGMQKAVGAVGKAYRGTAETDQYAVAAEEADIDPTSGEYVDAVNEVEQGIGFTGDRDIGKRGDFSRAQMAARGAYQDRSERGFFSDALANVKSAFNPQSAWAQARSRQAWDAEQQSDIANARGMDVQESQELDDYLGEGFMGYGQTWGEGSGGYGDDSGGFAGGLGDYGGGGFGEGDYM